MSLEQRVTVQKNIVNEDGVMEIFDEKELLFVAADKTLGNSLESGSLGMCAEALRRFRSLSWSASLALAKLLHGINQNWMEWEHEDGDTFLEWAVRETGMDKQTVRKRVCEWEFLSGHYIPKEFRGHIGEYTVRQLDKVYSICVNVEENRQGGYLNIVEEDYQITPENWRALSEAVDEYMVGDVVREIKGKPKNSNNMSLKIDNDGTLWVYQGRVEETIGQLSVGKDNKVVKKAIRRICENAGITERNNY